MKDTKQEIQLLCENISILTAEYLNSLRTHPFDDTKSLISCHYTFEAKLLKYVSELDGMTLSISLGISESDKRNDLYAITIQERYFDVCIEYRKTIEEFFSEAEILIKNKPDDLKQQLQRRTDLLLRKTVSVKTSIN